ncbi:MAG: rane-flanked domain protein [Actinomycetia bacterium]|nr:rane-flanked domain protein [Actinomycetes bacterium]
MADEEWRRLSRRMLLIHPVQELLRAWPVLLGLLFAGASGGHGSWWSLVGTTVVVVAGMARWFTTTYRISPQQVQVRKGLVRRQVLTVPMDRIRSVDVTANPFHRALGLAKVTVGTGRSDRKAEDLKLDALTTADAARLREELLHRRGTTPDPADSAAAPAQETLIAAVRPEWVRYGPFTLTGVLTVGVIAAAASRIVSETHVNPRRFGPLRTITGQFGRTTPALQIAEVVLALVVVITLASTITYVLAFLNFRLTRNNAGTLHVARGLITTRKTTIEERRLRGIELSEPLLLRAVGGARCIAITTGLRVGRGAERGGSLLLPPAPRAEAWRVATEILRRNAPVAGALVPHGRRARTRRYARALTVCLIVVIVLGVGWVLGWIPAGAWVASLALLPAGAWLAFDRFHALGHAVIDGMVVSRRGSLVRRRSMLSCDGIIGWNLRRSFWQRRAGLVSLTATTAAGKQKLLIQDIGDDEAVLLAQEALPGLLTPFLEVPVHRP